MARFIFVFISCFIFAGPSWAAESLTIERINSSPELEGSSPRSLSFSQNGKRLTFLQASPENIDVLDLWEYDLMTGKPRLLVAAKSLASGPVSEEEQARRERMRISQGGITERHISNSGSQIVIPSGGDLYLHQGSPSIERLTRTKGVEIDIKFSPRDGFVSYVRDQNLYLFDLKSRREIPVSSEGRGAVSFGTAEFIAQEEMHRYTGYWWSKDEALIALTRVDETPVKVVDRYDINAAGVTVTRQRYPEAGSANAKVRLGIVRVADLRKGSRRIQWVPIKSDDFYLADVKWTPDRKLIYQVQSRDQKKLEVLSFDPTTGQSKTLLTETDPQWVNLNEGWRWLTKQPQFIWVSDKSGHKHIYLHETSGKLNRQLTSGDWDVDEVKGLDEETGFVYFTATKKSPLESHFYRVPLAGGEPEALTSEEGWHDITMSEDAKFFVRRSSKPNTPASVFLHKASGEQVSILTDNEVKEGHPLFPYRESLAEPEFGSFKGPSGDDLYYKLIKPRSFDPKKKYPLIMIGYGGPTAQVVRKAWGGRNELLAQVLAQRGFVVASIDNRGSSRRGEAFADALYRAFGTVEVEDQVAGAKYFINKGFIEKDRVGFYGWSYGGYLSLMLASQAPEVFKANVAGAPVTDFALYDTHYTERYLGDPRKEPDVYKRANVLERPFSSSNHVLIIHGMADDNVLFTNSTLLFKKLQEAGVVYESLSYPGAKHGLYGRANQIHSGRSIVDFFERRLMKP